jgi:hypothetical protein
MDGHAAGERPKNLPTALPESSQPEEVRATRDSIVLGVRQALDTLAERQREGTPVDSLGPVQPEVGIVRDIVQNPFGGPDLMSEATKPTGAYFHVDPSTGKRTGVVNTGKVVYELSDDPFEQIVAGPEAGYGTGSAELAALKLVKSDGTYEGLKVWATGFVDVATNAGDVHRRGPLSGKNLATATSLMEGCSAVLDPGGRGVVREL